MDAFVKLLKKELYKKSLYDFVKDFWHCCEPNKFVDGFLVQFYCESFQYMCRDWIETEEVEVELPPLSDDINVVDIRGTKKNININVPPRHTKSLIFNVFGPVWLWINAPIKAASVSHTTSLAGEMNGKRIKILDSEQFKEMFGDEVWLETNARGKLVDKRGGELYSIARESFTGHGADIIINDDLTNAETARRDREEMISAWSYYQNTMPSRINDRKKYIIMNIQQRLAPNDITGHILADPKLAAEYTFVVLPAIFMKKTYVVCPISGTVHVFNVGDTLWPERFGDYQALRNEVGEAVFETQYLQNPIASDKTVVKESMIHSADKIDIDMNDASIMYASHDFPVKDKETSDFLGSILGFKIGATLYIRDCLEKKMAFKKSVDYVQRLDSLYPGIIQVIEDKANGSPILNQLQDVVAGMQAYQPGTNSKIQRLESATLYMESGNVVFLKTKWNKETHQWEYSDGIKNLIRRLLNFPFVEHDDIVDAFSQLVLFVFMDRRYMVYGRAFNEDNLLLPELAQKYSDYSSIFFNKEGDIWKACEIAVQYNQYGDGNSIIVVKEKRFKANVADGINMLKAFAPDKTVFIDCSATEAMYGISSSTIAIEKYTTEDFNKSVAELNLAFAKNRVLIADNCNLAIADIENFKLSKSKDENVKYATTKDGFVACFRIALKYFGGVI